MYAYPMLCLPSGEPEPTRSLCPATQVCYAFRDIFSKDRSFRLPPHWRICTINLLEWVPLPKGRLYLLSINEEEATETYIREGLTQGIIRPSTSPVTTRFFFVKKKDGGLHPCIDYRPLNAITVKRQEPMPLNPSALEQLQKARYFTKLNLCSVYNLEIQRGDEWKMSFITITGQYEYPVMPYGLANSPFYLSGFYEHGVPRHDKPVCNPLH